MDFTYLKNFMDRLCDWRIPGNAVKVCLGGKEVFSYSAGFNDIDKKTPITDDLLFNIYSCSKIATVTSALQLFEKGFFLMNTPLYEFIPEFRDIYVKKEGGDAEKAKKPITIGNLFTMTSGLSYDCERPVFERIKKETDGKMDTLSVVKSLSLDPLDFEPGEKWQYSLSHDVLAAVVEVISGKKFRDYVKENIFEPLGMKNSFYHNESVRDRMAEQYKYEVGETDFVKLQSGEIPTHDGKIIKIDKKIAHVFGPEYDSGGAGITTTVSDYSRLITALSICDGKILSKNTINLLKTNHLTEKQMPSLTWPHLKGYGYGLGVRTLIDKTAAGSNGNKGEFGWGGAAGASFIVDTDIGLSVFYTHHMLNPQEEFYQPRLRNVVYSCLRD